MDAQCNHFIQITRCKLSLVQYMDSKGRILKFSLESAVFFLSFHLRVQFFFVQVHYLYGTAAIGFSQSAWLVISQEILGSRRTGVKGLLYYHKPTPLPVG